jgi:hypothetical protein
MKEILFLVQTISALLLFSSKYFLAMNNPLGWWLSASGYLLACFYNAKTNLKICALVVFSLALLSFYGVYKWHIEITGLRNFDYLVIFCTILIAIFLAKKGWENKKALWQHQTIGTILFMVAFLLLGLRHEEGWFMMLAGHLITGYIYVKTKAYVYVTVQTFSAYIALAQILSLPLPFSN